MQEAWSCVLGSCLDRRHLHLRASPTSCPGLVARYSLPHSSIRLYSSPTAVHVPGEEDRLGWGWEEVRGGCWERAPVLSLFLWCLAKREARGETKALLDAEGEAGRDAQETVLGKGSRGRQRAELGGPGRDPGRGWHGARWRDLC